MDLDACVTHEYKLKEVYKKSRIMVVYYSHIKFLQNMGILSNVTAIEPTYKEKDYFRFNTIQKEGLLPKHLSYTFKDQQVLMYDEYDRLSERELKKLIKKKLLRKIFLFVLDQFLTPYIFNVDFHAYWFMVSDIVQFTTADQFSDVLFKQFFGLPNYKFETEKII